MILMDPPYDPKSNLVRNIFVYVVLKLSLL